MRHWTVRAILALLAAVSLTMPGCDCGGGGGGGIGTFSLQALPLNLPFGTVRVGNNSTLTVTLTNNSANPIDVTAGTFTTGTEYSIPGGTFPITLAGGGNQTVDVIFAPTTVGNHTDTVSFAHTGVGPAATVNVSGAGALADIVANTVTAIGGGPYITSDPFPISREFREGAGVDVANAFDVQYILSLDQVVDPGDTVITTENVPTLTASQIVTGSLAPIPTTPAVATGSYYLGMVVDSGSAETEANETNNTVWSATTYSITLTQIIISGNVSSGAGPVTNARVYAGTLFDDVDAAGDYSIVVPSAGSYSVSCYAPGLIGQTVTVSAPVVQNFTLAAPTNVLCYQTTSASANPLLSAAQALSDLGITANVVNTGAAFEAALAGNPDVAIYDTASGVNNLTATGLQAYATYITGGGRAIVSAWHVQSASQIWAALGISAATGTNTEPVYRWDTSHAAMNFPMQWPDATTWQDINWSTNGQVITVSGGTAIGGSSPTASPSTAKLVEANGGRTLFCAFVFDDADDAAKVPIDADSDTFGDANEMWRNFITYVLGH